MDVLSLKEMVLREEEIFATGVTAGALMEAAGEAMAHRITELYPKAEKFVVLIGKGNNGGDGLVIARHLVEDGRQVHVVVTVPAEYLGDLPRARLGQLGIPFPNLKITPWREDFVFPGSDGVVIDALLGVQARGVLRGTLGEVIAKLNEARASRFFRVVALDIPTGLAAYEEGPPPLNRDDAVVADITLAVGFAKEVLCREALAAWVGRLEVVPWSNAILQSNPRQALLGHELAGLLPRRNALSHKGDFGRLVIIAGSTGFTGAPALCARGAQAMGAGLLSVVTRADVSATVAALVPHEVMVSVWPEKGETPTVVQHASAIVFGPGLGVGAKTTAMLGAVLALGCPVLIDADGLNVLSQNLDLLQKAKGPVVLTPHPGEMAKLIGRSFTVDEREAVVRAFTERYNVTLVLKGTRTLATLSGHPLFINTTGNPGLSTGGSGDTLSGMIGALLAQGLAPLDAARLGVWLHGHAADLVLAERGCEEGMTPTMLSARIGRALVSLRAQAVMPAGLLERAKQL